MNNFEILAKALVNNKYFNNTDLRMNKKIGIRMTNDELNDFLSYKENVVNPLKEDLPLKSFNSKSIYYFNSKELVNAMDDYLQYLYNDISKINPSMISRNIGEILNSMILFEIEGSLKIEGVYTTRRDIIGYLDKEDRKDINSIIVNNMKKGLEFILGEPAFNKENLKTLYYLLTDDCLRDDLKLNGKYYRDAGVEIGGHKGCDVDKIDECMDSLFAYVDGKIKEEKMALYTPFIAHYYILYIHPYFDYNGRTARMVEIWISLLMSKINPIYLSEGINENKTDYYKAIDDTRNSHNDLTYFITYLVKLANTFYTLYLNIEKIKDKIEVEGESLTYNEVHYLKKILINNKKGWFSYKKFIEFCEVKISKQAALKILNTFCEKGLLITKTNSKNEKIFLFNEDMIEYELNY